MMCTVSVVLNASVLRSVLIVLVVIIPGFDFHVLVRPGQYKLNMLVLMPANTTEAVANRTAGAVIVALNAIGRRGTLQGLGVDWHVDDPQCSPILTARRFYDLWKNPIEMPHVIIGGYCEKVCEMLAFISHTQKLPFLGVGCKTNEARNHVVFPSFLTMDYDPGSALPVLYALMETFKWQRLVILTTTDDSFMELGAKAKSGVEAKGWTAIFMLTTIDLVPDGFTSPEADAEIKLILADIKKQARIIFFCMPKMHAARILVLAQGQDMYNGEYAFIGYGFNVVDAPAINASEKEWRTAKVGLFSFVPANIYSKLENDRLVELVNDEQKRQSPQQQLGWIQRQMLDPADSMYVNYAGNLYIAIRVYAFLVNETLKKMRNTPVGGSAQTDSIVRDGALLLSKIHDIEAEKSTANIDDHLWMLHFDESGMRIPVWLLNNSAKNDEQTTLFTYDKMGQKITEPFDIQHVTWPGDATEAPSDVPTCGWDREKCPGNEKLILIWTCSILGVLTVAGGFVAFYVTWRSRRIVERRTLEDWRIQWSEITIIGDNVVGRFAPSEVKQTSLEAGSSISEVRGARKSVKSENSRLFTLVGICKGKTVAVRMINRDSVDILQPAIYSEMKHLFYISHQNVNPFIGVCSEAPNVCVLMLYADRGSLQDVLAEPKYDINWEFRMCFATDIAKGMRYLHQSAVGPHGHLRSSNCVVDRKWGCRITDYGLQQFKRSKSQTSNFRWNSDLLWTAPEILKKPETNRDRNYGTKEGDVYSFGIIVSEIITKHMPYHMDLETISPEDVVLRLTSDPQFRPDLPPPLGPKGWNSLARNCWHRKPEARPTFRRIVKKLMSIHGRRRILNLMERTQHMMENALQRKSLEIASERRKTDMVLYSLLPQSQAAKIFDGKDIPPQKFDAVTVCFCETSHVFATKKKLTAIQVTHFLVEMFDLYDGVIRKYKVVEISDRGSKNSIILGSGLPESNAQHALDICDLSLEMMSVASTFKTPLVPELSLHLKISIHSGPALAVVIWRTFPRYCVSGEAVDSVRAMQSTSKAMRIQISETAYGRIVQAGSFTVEQGEKITNKDGTPIRTYWLTGKKGYLKPLPHAMKRRPSISPEKETRNRT